MERGTVWNNKNIKCALNCKLTVESFLFSKLVKIHKNQFCLTMMNILVNKRLRGTEKCLIYLNFFHCCPSLKLSRYLWYGNMVVWLKTELCVIKVLSSWLFKEEFLFIFKSLQTHQLWLTSALSECLSWSSIQKVGGHSNNSLQSCHKLWH